MKNLIIIMGTTLLGIIIFNMMLGNNATSLKNISREMMMETIDYYNSIEVAK